MKLWGVFAFCVITLLALSCSDDENKPVSINSRLTEKPWILVQEEDYFYDESSNLKNYVVRENPDCRRDEKLTLYADSTAQHVFVCDLINEQVGRGSWMLIDSLLVITVKFDISSASGYLGYRGYKGYINKLTRDSLVIADTTRYYYMSSQEKMTKVVGIKKFAHPL